MTHAVELKLNRGKALVSPEDWGAVAGKTWYLHVNSEGRRFAATSVRHGDSKRTVLLQRAILGLGADTHTWVLFLNGDTLDCRRENIVAVRHRRVVKRLVGT